MATLQCIVVTPEKTAIDQQVSFVVVPMYDGELGIGANHSPLIGRLGFGELRLRSQAGTVERYYVDGGFVQVAGNVVTLLTGKLAPARDLDEKSARDQLVTAMKRSVATDDLLTQRDRLVEQARAQLRSLQRAGKN